MGRDEYTSERNSHRKVALGRRECSSKPGLHGISQSAPTAYHHRFDSHHLYMKSHHRYLVIQDQSNQSHASNRRVMLGFLGRKLYSHDEARKVESFHLISTSLLEISWCKVNR